MRASTAREVRTGGERIGNKGYFYQPTVMTDVPQGRADDERGALRPPSP